MKSSDRSSAETAALSGAAGFAGGLDGVATAVFPGAGLASGLLEGGGVFLPNSEKTTRYFQLKNGLRRSNGGLNGFITVARCSAMRPRSRTQIEFRSRRN